MDNEVTYRTTLQMVWFIALKLFQYLVWSMPHTLLLGIPFTLLYLRYVSGWHIANGCIQAIVPEEHLFGKPSGGQTHGVLVFWASVEAMNSPRVRAHEFEHVDQALRYGPIYMSTYGLHFVFNASVQIVELIVGRREWKGWRDFWRSAYLNVFWEKRAREKERRAITDGGRAKTRTGTVRLI